MPRGEKDAEGVALIVVMIVLLALTFIGIGLMQTAHVGVQRAGTERTGESALAIAEAGIAFGLDKLRNEPFDLESDESGAYNRALDDTNAPPINDESCNSVSTCQLFGWHELTAGPTGFGDGSYRVAVQDDDEPDNDDTVDTNQRILIRSLGIGQDGSRRLVEVAISVE